MSWARRPVSGRYSSCAALAAVVLLSACQLLPTDAQAESPPVGPENACALATRDEVATHLGYETIPVGYIIPNLSVPPINVVGMGFCFFAPGGTGDFPELTVGVTPAGANAEYATAAYEAWKERLPEQHTPEAVEGLGVEATWVAPETLVVVTERQVLGLVVHMRTNRFNDDTRNFDRARLLADLLLERDLQPVSTEPPEQYLPGLQSTEPDTDSADAPDPPEQPTGDQP